MASAMEVQDPEADIGKAQLPERLHIRCGDIVGEYIVSLGRVYYGDKEISPTEFEKLGGRGAAKKWRSSVRLVGPGGADGGTVGQWLQDNDLQSQSKQMISAARHKGTHHASRMLASRGVRKSLPALPHVNLLEHLDKQYIGLLPGDPTAVIPDEMPSTSDSESELIEVDVRQMTHDQLMQMSAFSAENPLATATLPVAPGVEEGRVAHITGRKPKRKATVTDKAKARAALDRYLGGSASEPPWHDLGVPKAPIIGGRDLNLRKLWQEVQAFGGFAATTEGKLWARVATKLGVDMQALTNASSIVKNHYQRFLLEREGKPAAATSTPSVSGGASPTLPSMHLEKGAVQNIPDSREVVGI